MKTSSEARKQIAFRILNEIFNEGTLSVIDETCSKNIVVHNPRVPDGLKGIEAFKGFVKDFLWAFRDIHLHVDELHAEGDMADAHTTFTATNRAPFLGSPATQKEVSTEPVFFFKFGPDGKVVEHWQENIP
jgi:predicted SnoaL-like aldol condensation-catalyzing enzyme